MTGGLGCDICGRSTRLVVDHSHETGRIRGTLCAGCNSALGWYEQPTVGERPARPAFDAYLARNADLGYYIDPFGEWQPPLVT